MRIVKVNGLDPVAWQATPGNIYVGRLAHLRTGKYAGHLWANSLLGNPWKATSREEIADALGKYEAMMRRRIGEGVPWLLELLQSLTDETTLGCWCVNLGRNDRSADGHERCHAEVIRRVWREMFQKERI